jgi:acyl-CoA thioester hydrolase
MNIFYTERKIYYHHTDAGKVVYYGRYLDLLEEGRTDFCANKGIDTAEYIKKGIEFPVVHFEIDYKAPARYGDTVRIYTYPEKIGNASVHFLQEIKKGEQILIKSKIVWACVRSGFKSIRVPDEIRQALLNE